MHFMWNSTVEEIKGDGVVNSMIIKDTKTGELREITCDIVTEKYIPTSGPGVFAAGDVFEKQLRQVVTACGDGAVAVTEAQRYVESLED